MITEKKKSTKKIVLITNRAKAHIGSSNTKEANLLKNKTKNLASLIFPPLFLLTVLPLKMWSERQVFYSVKHYKNQIQNKAMSRTRFLSQAAHPQASSSSSLSFMVMP